MTIENLIKAMPPPAAPVETFSNGDWELIEAELGTKLPPDYKAFVRLYGLGDFMDFLTVNIPRSSSPYVRLEAEVHAVASIARALEDDKAPYPFPFWPTPGGLLACGTTDFGDYLLWLTQGDPEDWTIVVWGRGLGIFQAFDCDLTDFLAGVAAGEIEPEEFPEDLLPCPPFRPSSNRPDGEYGISWRTTYGGSSAQGPDGDGDLLGAWPRNPPR